MLAEYKKSANTCIALGILAHIIVLALVLMVNIDSLILTFAIVIFSLTGGTLFILGLFSYAKGKGYNSALGLLGFLGIIGWIILACLPDKCKSA